MDTTTGRVRVTRDYVLDEGMDRVRQQCLPRASRPQHAPVKAAKDEGPRVSFEDFASNKPEDELDESIPDNGLSEPEDSDTDRPTTYEQNEGTGGVKGTPGKHPRQGQASSCHYADWRLHARRPAHIRPTDQPQEWQIKGAVRAISPR